MRKRGKGWKIFRITLIAGMVLAGSYFVWRYHGPAPEREIFQGVYYGCDRPAETAEGGGLVHWVRADLSVPGVSLYITPIDSDAKAQGWEYKLRHVSTVVADEHLAAAVNGTLFSSDSTLVRLPGDLGSSIETVVADHVVNHVHRHTYLFWWDENLVAHQEGTKPPSAAVLAKAKWGIGGQQPILTPDGISGSYSTDERTIIGADPQKKLVWMACFDKASYRFAANWMKAKGATIATAVDGGTSMAMVIGSGAKNVRSGTVTGNWRPVAVQFGFRANALP